MEKLNLSGGRHFKKALEELDRRIAAARERRRAALEGRGEFRLVSVKRHVVPRRVVPRHDRMVFVYSKKDRR